MNALQLVNALLGRFGQKEVATMGQTQEATSALRDLNTAIQKISTAHAFSWAEKNTPGSITAVAGTSIYTLATDVAHPIVAKHTYQGGGSIKVVDRKTLEQYRSDRSQTSDRNIPQWMTAAGVLQASASDTPAMRVELWPVPDSNFDAQVISYYYTFILADLSAATDIPLIPLDFHWLIVEVAETLKRRGPIRLGGDGIQSQIDLYSIASDEAKRGMAKLISREGNIQTSEMAWDDNDPTI